MRFLDAHYAWRTYPRAVAKLSRPTDVDHLIYFDGFVYVMDEERQGYSIALWMPRSEIWMPYVRRIA